MVNQESKGRCKTHCMLVNQQIHKSIESDPIDPPIVPNNWINRGLSPIVPYCPLLSPIVRYRPLLSDLTF
jgi:hypothetical protein